MNLQLAKFLSRIAGKVSPAFQYSLSYFHNRGRFPNLKKPNNLSEIIGYQMITGEINKFSTFADKVKVREHITSWGLVQYLPKLYGVWDRFDDVDFNQLPNQFALKTNHGAGGNYICFDKSKMNKEKAKKIIDDSLTKIYGGVTETHYSLITPKVFAEELLSENGKLPIDYKFHCCNGIVKGVLLVLERGSGKSKRIFYNENWKRLDIIKDQAATYNIDKPDKYDEMVSIANEICAKFKQVRVDLYYINNRIYIGELTFTPDGGILRSFTLEGLEFLGSAV